VKKDANELFGTRGFYSSRLEEVCVNCACVTDISATCRALGKSFPHCCSAQNEGVIGADGLVPVFPVITRVQIRGFERSPLLQVQHVLRTRELAERNLSAAATVALENERNCLVGE
jgi:hypothetical protein